MNDDIYLIDILPFIHMELMFNHCTICILIQLFHAILHGFLIFILQISSLKSESQILFHQKCVHYTILNNNICVNKTSKLCTSIVNQIILCIQANDFKNSSFYLV